MKEWLSANSEPLCISMLTVHLGLQFGKKFDFNQKELIALFKEYIVQDLTVDNYSTALDPIKGNDYENALQLVAAIRAGCNSIVTLGKKFAHRYEDIIPFFPHRLDNLLTF
jgi:hypothetical protein